MAVATEPAPPPPIQALSAEQPAILGHGGPPPWPDYRHSFRTRLFGLSRLVKGRKLFPAAGG